jgi:RNA polymerase sigma-70 factor (ECF subfamily)
MRSKTLLSAWQGLGGFEGRASLRTRLYRIATNRCLNARRSAFSRSWESGTPGVERPFDAAQRDKWLDHFPRRGGAIAVPLGPDARYEQTESISLAFVKPFGSAARQLAVLILRDVLGSHASGGRHATDVDSVNSALKRARASLKQRRQTFSDSEPRPDSASEDALVAKFVRAYEAADLDAIVALLTDDVFLSMPPMPLEYEGRAVVARFCANIFGAGRRFDLCRREPTVNRRSELTSRTDGIHHGIGLIVVTMRGRISAMTRFEQPASVVRAPLAGRGR